MESSEHSGKNAKGVLNIFGRTVPWERKSLANSGEYGNYCYEEHKITIDEEINQTKFIITILHEFIHALFNRLGYDQIIEQCVEEMICENIPKGLVENFDIKVKEQKKWLTKSSSSEMSD